MLFACAIFKQIHNNIFIIYHIFVCFVIFFFSSKLKVFIQIENVNDNAPLTEHPVYYPTVPEGSTAGVKILQLIAEDGDNDPLQKITYRITSGNPEGFFAINSSNGELLKHNIILYN